MSENNQSEIVELSSRKFLAGSAVLALGLLAVGAIRSLPSWVLAGEILITILLLFILGSIRYRLDKNALTYGAAGVILATFLPLWWPTSSLQLAMQNQGVTALWEFVQRNFLTLHGLEKIIHADTMLFILGLTFFVSAISQTRLLESVSFAILSRNNGRIVPTIILISALVSLASGVLDGVSMIGLMIRTTVIILLLSKVNGRALVYCVTVSTIITTVCGMWLAYGEPPNLIMKANLMPHLDDAFFLNYLAPAAVGCFLIVAWNVRQRLKGRRVDMENLDVMERHIADVRFLQAMRHGEVLDDFEFVETHKERLGKTFSELRRLIREGMSLGEALVRAEVPAKDRRHLLGEFVAEDLAEPLDAHFQEVVRHGKQSTGALRTITRTLDRMASERRRAQKLSGLAFIPFVGLLIWHAIHHEVPLFLASASGFVIAFAAVYKHPKTRRLVIRSGAHEETAEPQAVRQS